VSLIVVSEEATNLDRTLGDHGESLGVTEELCPASPQLILIRAAITSTVLSMSAFICIIYLVGISRI
jgi:hypothetical protein